MLDTAAFCSAPAIQDGTIVFVCDDAVWEVPAAGGRARRRTPRLPAADTPLPAAAGEPLFLAAAVAGTAQACAVEPDGAVRQLSWLAAPCRLLGRAAGGRLALASSAEQAFRHLSVGWLLDPATGSVERLDAPPLTSLCAGPDGARVIAAPGVDPRGRRGYAGGARGEIWLDGGSGRFAPIPLTGLDAHTPLLLGGRIFFVGAEIDGGDDLARTPNLWSCRPDGGDPRRHTSHTRLAVHSAGTDGRRIVYCVGGDLFVLDPDGDEQRLDVTLAEPAVGRLARAEPLRDVADVAGSPTADALAVAALGQLFEADAELGRTTWIVLPGLCSHVRYLPDGALLAVVRRPDGDEFVRVEGDRQGSRALPITGSLGHVVDLAVSESGALAVCSDERQRVLAVDLDAGRCAVLETSRHGRVEHVAASSAGDLCCYAVPTGPFRTVVRVRRPDGELVAETDPELADLVPRFAPDGRSVLYLSVVAEGEHDLATRLTRLDLTTGVATRVPTAHGWFTDLAVLDRDAFLLTGPGRPPPDEDDAWPFQPAGDDAAPTRAWAVRADRLWHCGRLGVVAGIGTSLYRADVGPEGVTSRRLPLPDALTVDPVPLWSAALTEAWRLALDHAVADVDAASRADVFADYAQQTDRACGARDAQAVANELLGHLRLSHAAVRSAVRRVPAYGLLGVDVRFDAAAGGWRVTGVPAVDVASDGPAGLADPVLDVKIGDIVARLDGHDVGDRHPCSLLDGAAGRRVEAVLRTPTGRRHVRFVVLADERRLRYDDWTSRRRALVGRLSGGTVGYLHLPDVADRTRTATAWWLRCHEDIDALVVDVRYNEGGVLGAEIGELLCRRPLGAMRGRRTVPRAIPAGTARRRLVIVTNRFTSSGGELLAETVRQLTGATVVGERTLGAGVGQGATHRLPDGSELLLPELRLVEPEEWVDIENHGVVPDLPVHWHAEFQVDGALAAAVRAASAAVTNSS